MTPDSGFATSLIGILFLFVSCPHLAEPFLEFTLYIGREVSTLLLLSGVVIAYATYYTQTAIAALMLAIYMLPMMWTIYPRSDRRRLRREIAVDVARFNPNTSLDIQMADGSVTHDSPNMLEKGKDNSPLLIFPPSQEVLHELSG